MKMLLILFVLFWTTGCSDSGPKVGTETTLTLDRIGFPTMEEVPDYKSLPFVTLHSKNDETRYCVANGPDLKYVVELLSKDQHVFITQRVLDPGTLLSMYSSPPKVQKVKIGKYWGEKQCHLIQIIHQF